MRTRWYFIIPVTILAGFAAWYQDFNREQNRLRDLQQQEQAEAERVARDEALRQRKEAEREARLAAERAREERIARERERVAARERRDQQTSELAHSRSEQQALAGRRERLLRTIQQEEEHLQQTARARASVAVEQEFLRDYIAQAHHSLERMHAAIASVNAAVATAPQPNRPLPDSHWAH